MRPNIRAVMNLAGHAQSDSGLEAARVAVWTDFGLPEIRHLSQRLQPAMTFVLVDLHAAGAVFLRSRLDVIAESLRVS